VLQIKGGDGPRDARTKGCTGTEERKKTVASRPELLQRKGWRETVRILTAAAPGQGG
jgi:hypothetical protein